MEGHTMGVLQAPVRLGRSEEVNTVELVHTSTPPRFPSVRTPPPTKGVSLPGPLNRYEGQKIYPPFFLRHFYTHPPSL